MSHTEYFAGLSRLVTLFGDADAGDDDRLAAVRVLVALARERALEVDVASAGTAADADGVTPEAAALLAVLHAHRVRRLVIRRGTGPRELAQLAGLLARVTAPPPGAADDAIQRGLNELHIWGVRLDFHTADGELIAALPHALRAAVEAVAVADAPVDVASAYAAVASAVEATRAGAGTASAAAAAVTGALVCLIDGQLAGGGAGRDADAHRDAFARLLEAELEFVVRAVVEGTVAEAWRVVRAAPERGVRLLINRLGDAETIEERRRCFNAILDMGGSIDPLLDGLRDPRWYVVRNVALVLGELHEPAAVRPLARALHGADDRVRHAAAQALARIDGPAATHALIGALRDPGAAVRLLAARALQRAPAYHVPVSPALIVSRLSVESDVAVAQELVGALRTIDTPEAHAALTVLAGEVDGAPARPLDGAAGAEALRVLGELPRPRLVQRLREFAQSADPHLRRAALRVARRLIARAA